VGALLGSPAEAQECGPPLENNNFGRPIDYTNSIAEAANIAIVERYHFNSRVEALLEGMTGVLPGDIDYTLRQIPNHYRALNAMAKWQLQHGYPPGASHLTADCYFVRALSFRPEDGTLHLIYATYLHRKKDYDAARESYRQAEKFGPQSAELYYNMGLLYLDTKEYSLARSYARKAYELGYPLQGLRRKLSAINQWREPEPAAVPDAAARAETSK
jgi:tetratricopeptide (TPR) repeat protein